MEHKLHIDGLFYLPVRDASKVSGFTGDYLARLCRTGKLVGRRMGKSWLVEEASLKAYTHNAEKAEQVRRDKLASDYARHTQAQKIQHQPETLPRSVTAADVHALLRTAMLRRSSPSKSAEVFSLIPTVHRVPGKASAFLIALCLVAVTWNACAPSSVRMVAADLLVNTGGTIQTVYHSDPQQPALALRNATQRILTPLHKIALDVGNEELDGIAQVGNALTGYSNATRPAGS